MSISSVDIYSIKPDETWERPVGSALSYVDAVFYAIKQHGSGVRFTDLIREQMNSIKNKSYMFINILTIILQVLQLVISLYLLQQSE